MSAEARSIPASVTTFDGHGLPAWESRTGALRFWLIIGTLDTPDVRELHDVLGAQARVCLTADLAGLDYQHYLTAAAVLSVAARKMQDGLPRGRCTLITGGAGCGKTLLGLQFLVAGAREFKARGSPR